LPSHYADWTTNSKVYKKGEKKFFKVLRRKYTTLLFKILRYRYIVTVILILILVIIVPVSIYMLGVEMFGDEDMDQFRVLIKLPEGTSLEETDRIVQKFEEKAAELPQHDVGVYIVNVGLMQGNNEWLTRKNVAQIIFQLEPIEEREHTTEELLEMMREKTHTISGPTSLEFELISGGPPVGKPISVRVQGKYLNEIKQASLALQDSLRKIKGTEDITDDYPPGKKEIRIKVDQEKAAMYGFTTQYVAMNVRSAFDGITATEYREGDEEIDVIVKYNQKNRSSMNDVLFFNLTNAVGQTVPVREMVNFEIKSGPDEIKRFNQKRTILVVGNIDEETTKLDEVNNKLKALFPRIEKQFPGIHFEIGGQFEEFTNIFGEIGSLFVLSLILIFLILGTQFNSYSQPLIILTTVPFALIGATLGLIISNNPFSIIAMYGFVALAGIVVNDAIVLIDFMNNRRPAEKMSVHRYWSSIVEAGRLRLRPIILTSLTTVSGLVPMAFGLGGSSEMWAPLANVILFGLLVSTILTLFIIPSFIAILDDIKSSRQKVIVS
jgi:multidrug efflux pump subunit AcrB